MKEPKVFNHFKGLLSFRQGMESLNALAAILPGHQGNEVRLIPAHEIAQPATSIPHAFVTTGGAVEKATIMPTNSPNGEGGCNGRDAAPRAIDSIIDLAGGKAEEKSTPEGHPFRRQLGLKLSDACFSVSQFLLGLSLVLAVQFEVAPEEADVLLEDLGLVAGEELGAKLADLRRKFKASKD